MNGRKFITRMARMWINHQQKLTRLNLSTKFQNGVKVWMLHAPTANEFNIRWKFIIFLIIFMLNTCHASFEKSDKFIILNVNIKNNLS
jgi:hypothetical protein